MSAVRFVLVIFLLSLFGGCGESSTSSSSASSSPDTSSSLQVSSSLTEKYATVRLDADVSGLSTNRKEMVRLFIGAAQSMDGIFWEQAYGNRDSLLQTISASERRRFVNINYGPWDRLNGNEPFVEGVGPKPPGANFYPDGVTAAQIESAARSDDAIGAPYTMVRRLPDGSLTGLSYHRFFAPTMERVASRLQEAAARAENERVARYLERRAEALTTGDYRPSDRAWMNMNNKLDLIIGPIEPYEDQLLGRADPCKRVIGVACDSGGTCSVAGRTGGAPSTRVGKAAVGALVLRRNRAWNERLNRYAELLPRLQDDVSMLGTSKQAPSALSRMSVYDVLYGAGAANAGPKPMALNLPNDPVVRDEAGARRLQLRNARRATFDEILVPLSTVLIANDQRSQVTFGAAFSNVLLHDMAHGLGVEDTSAEQSGGEALPDHHTTIEESKADALGLSSARLLADAGALDGELMDHYVSFLARTFHTLRFGTERPHGRATLIGFNYFREKGAVTRDADTGTYAVRPDSMTRAVTDLAREILTLQAKGDPEAVEAFLDTYGTMPDQLQADLQRLDTEGVPVDITYEQGPSVLQGLSPATAAR